jgi:hypothetical protein
MTAPAAEAQACAPVARLRSDPPTTPGRAEAVAPQRGRPRPTLSHLFEDWKRKQTRPRTTDWKNQLLERAAGVFGAETTVADESKTELKALHAKIG